jgi:hypothetical protein
MPVNRKGPFLFALDTGGERTITSPAMTADLLGVSPDSTIKLRGISGPMVKVHAREGGVNANVADVVGPNGRVLRLTSPTRVPEFRFTHNETGGTQVVSFSLTPLSHADGIEVSGLLGFDVLDQFAIEVNFRNGLTRILFHQNRRYLADKSY